jgi:hypothetical protein
MKNIFYCLKVSCNKYLLLVKGNVTLYALYKNSPKWTWQEWDKWCCEPPTLYTGETWNSISLFCCSYQKHITWSDHEEAQGKPKLNNILQYYCPSLFKRMKTKKVARIIDMNHRCPAHHLKKKVYINSLREFYFGVSDMYTSCFNQINPHYLLFLHHHASLIFSSLQCITLYPYTDGMFQYFSF